jgi:hypothetical protein
MLPIIVAILYAIALTLLVLACAYRLSGKAVFGTAGHTSSEFKLVLFVNAACVIDWVSAAALLEPAQHKPASWYAFAAVNIAFILSRAMVKVFASPALHEPSCGE